jgi:hypothetical protein
MVYVSYLYLERKLQRFTISVPSDRFRFDIAIKDCSRLGISPSATRRYFIGVEAVVAQSMDIIKTELPLGTGRDAAYRVPPLMFSRLSRGGKSTVLNAIFHKLQSEGINCIIITFSGNFRFRSGETQKNAILRLIASQLVSSLSKNPDQDIECDEAALDERIGNESFVLLIDELNTLSNNEPVDAEAGLMLRNMFLDKCNRYLVFTTHIPLDLDLFSGHVKSTLNAPRGVMVVPMPVETNLDELRKMFDDTHSVTPAEVSLYGGIPSLIFSVKALHEMHPSVRFRMIVLPDNFNRQSLLHELIDELVSGCRNLSNKNLRVFDRCSSSPEQGKVQWPLCYIKCILETCTPLSMITTNLIECITAIEVLAKEIGSGKDWEYIVQFSLIVQSYHHQLFGGRYLFEIASMGPTQAVHIFHLNSRTAEEAKTEIFDCCRQCNETALCLFFPKFASFPTFDGFIAYHAPGQTSEPRVVGVQMKLGNDCPTERGVEFNWVSKGYLIRGIAANRNYTSPDGFWQCMTNSEIDSLVGYSLGSIRPCNW